MTQKSKLLVAMIALGVIAACGGGAKEDIRSAAFLSKTAADLNEMLPRVEGDIEATSAEGLEGVLVFNYRLLKLRAGEIDRAAFAADIKPEMLRAACGSPDVRDKYFKNGVTIRYSYVDKDGTPLVSFDILPTDCPA
jgi:hypothetical protein